MTTEGVPDPPNSPLASQHGDMESQFGDQHGSGASNQEEQLDEKMLKVVSATVKGLLAELLPQLLKPQRETKGTSDDKKGKLEEKYFRRIEKFNGDPSQFRTWLFNVKVSLGQVDQGLAEEINKVLSREDRKRFPPDWDPAKDDQVDKGIYDKYHMELYGIL
eukprot:6802003-Karenia_brevis.AAC.1